MHSLECNFLHQMCTCSELSYFIFKISIPFKCLPFQLFQRGALKKLQLFASILRNHHWWYHIRRRIEKRKKNSLADATQVWSFITIHFCPVWNVYLYRFFCFVSYFIDNVLWTKSRCIKNLRIIKLPHAAQDHCTDFRPTRSG